MKLNIKIHNAAPRVEKIHLTSELAGFIDSYVQFYQRELGTSVTVEKAITEMLLAFVKSDRDFMRWHKGKEDEPQEK